MIITIPITDVATLTIGVTDQMQRDMEECRRMIREEKCKSCSDCSWCDQKFENEDFCLMPVVVNKVLFGGNTI